MYCAASRKVILFAFFVLAASGLYSWESYDVQIQGIQDKDVVSVLKSSSQLLTLKNNLPSTNIALKRRAEADIQNFIKALHSLGYYNAKVDINIDFQRDPALIVFSIDTGPLYPIADFKVLEDKQENNPEDTSPLSKLNLQDLGILLNQPARAKDILSAEEQLLQFLSSKGYPLATITKREIVADQKEKVLYVTLHVTVGPKVCFGSTTINGLTTVKEEFFENKIGWKTAKTYDPEDIELTQTALEASGLFSSISITPADEPCANGSLPISIDVIEAKHRSIAAGISYATQRGPGLNAEWEHRNIRGMGERFNIKTNLWKDTQEGKMLYVLPDFKHRGQDLLLSTDLVHDMTKGYTDTSLTLSAIIEKQVNERTRLSYGGQYKFITTTHTDNNRDFNLLKIPFQLRWNNSNNLLNPTTGQTLNLKLTPSLEVIRPQFAYCISSITTTAYYPLTCDDTFVLAGKATIGSIFGASKHSIPPSERFYAGSENTLRGYEYLTVSPLSKGKDKKPIGGRSMMIFSLEARMRFTEKFGGVVFYDIGNVYAPTLPVFNHKQLESVGVGVRYHTPVGPLRLDVAVPLDKRKHFDSPFQIYLNIGQSF